MNDTAAAAGSSNSSTSVMATMPSPSSVADTSKAVTYDFDPSISEEERRFYLKAYATVEAVRERKVHCTVCKAHIGTAPGQEDSIKMHPILRVTHCLKCHDFYNSGEFSKGEDGSELYCRWCGQGGEVYCCSSCPYVFCKSCIVKNLSKGVVADIEQNENWNCFSCAPKILWPLRAQHWALMNYIDVQKKEINSMNLPEHEFKVKMAQDRSRCCRLAKSKCGNMSDSMESLDSVASKRSHGSSGSAKKPLKHAATSSPQQPGAKRSKPNDEVVCTPDLLSMLEPDCQITVSQKNNPPRAPMASPATSSPRIMSIQQPNFGMNTNVHSSTPKSSAPPPLVLRNTAIKLRPAAPAPIVRRTVIGPRTPAPGGGNGTPVYHTINGYRIDLNSAAQQETFRLPNGKLIQVKRQGPPPGSGPANTSPNTNSWQIQTQAPQPPQRVVPQTIASRPVQITQHPYPGPNIQQQSPQHPPQVVRYHGNVIGSTTINAIGHNGAPLQVINGQIPQHQPPPMQQNVPQQLTPGAPIRPVMVRHIFANTPIGSARTQLQEQVFNAMEICTHLTNKVQTLTNSNAYKQAKNYLEVKELYIHLSYLLTYAIGRFKGLQDKCLADMRNLGFGNDADCLENGQLAADKQASDDEDNEIEIVEPKHDLINLDSDEEEPPQPQSPKKTLSPIRIQKHVNTHQALTQPTSVQAKIVVPPLGQSQPPPLQPQSLPTQTLARRPATIRPAAVDAPLPDYDALIPPADDNMDLMSMAQSFLASMLEVDIHEGSGTSNSAGSADMTQYKKQPRKKLTNKPNPTLLKQKARMERERLEELKRNDLKLKMKCAVELKKAEDEFPYAKEMLAAKLKEKEEQLHTNTEAESEKSTTVVVDMGKETVEVQLVIEEEDNMNSSTEETKGSASKAIINISAGEESPQKKIILGEENEKSDQQESKKMETTTEDKGVDNEVEDNEVIKCGKIENEEKCNEKQQKDVSEEIKENGKDTETLKNLETKVNKENNEDNTESANGAKEADNEKENDKDKGVSTEVPIEPMEEDDKAEKRDSQITDDNNEDYCSKPAEEDAMEKDDTEDITPIDCATAKVSDITNEEITSKSQPMEVEETQDTTESVVPATESATVDDVQKSNVIQDVEDVEVYKEIEKVLQLQKSDKDQEEQTAGDGDEVVEEKQIDAETGKGHSEKTETESPTVQEKELDNMPSVDKSVGNSLKTATNELNNIIEQNDTITSDVESSSEKSAPTQELEGQQQQQQQSSLPPEEKITSNGKI